MATPNTTPKYISKQNTLLNTFLKPSNNSNDINFSGTPKTIKTKRKTNNNLDLSNYNINIRQLLNSLNQLTDDNIPQFNDFNIETLILQHNLNNFTVEKVKLKLGNLLTVINGILTKNTFTSSTVENSDLIGKLKRIIEKYNDVLNRIKSILTGLAPDADVYNNAGNDNNADINTGRDEVEFLIPIFPDIQNEHNSGNWYTLTNNEEQDEHLYSIVNNNKNTITTGNALNLEEPENLDKIQKYLIQCEEYQVYYNQKHNEIINLIKHLKLVIDTLVKLIHLIEQLCDIERIRPLSGLTGRLKLPNLPDILKPINKKAEAQKAMMDIVRRIIPLPGQTSETQSNETNDASYGAISQLQQQGGGTIVSLVIIDDDNFTMRLLDNIPDSVSVAYRKLEINNSVLFLQDNEYLIGKVIESPNEDENEGDDGNSSYKFQIIKKTDGFNFDTFNHNIEQENNIQILKYKLDDGDELFSLVVALRNIEKHTMSYLTNMQQRIAPLQNLDELENNIPETENIKQIVKKTKYNEKLKRIENERKTITVDETNLPYIQNILYRCYDLQGLYLIKHAEVIALFKLIMFFTYMIIENYIILLFILELFILEGIPIHKLPITITTPLNLLRDGIKILVKNQAGIINSIVNKSTTGTAPTTPTEMVGGENNQVGGTIDSVLYNYLTDDMEIPISTTINKLGELEDYISDMLGNQNTELNNEDRKKFFKAFLLVRHARLEKALETDGIIGNEALREKITKELEKINTQLILDDTGTILSGLETIQLYQDFIKDSIFDKHILGKIKTETAKFKKIVPLEDIRRFEENIKGYENSRGEKVCKLGDVSCLSLNLDAARSLVESVNLPDEIKDNMNNDEETLILADVIYSNWTEIKGLLDNELNLVKNIRNNLRRVAEYENSTIKQNLDTYIQREEEERRRREEEERRRKEEEELARKQSEKQSLLSEIQTLVDECKSLIADIGKMPDNVLPYVDGAAAAAVRPLDGSEFENILRAFLRETGNLETGNLETSKNNIQKIKENLTRLHVKYTSRLPETIAKLKAETEYNSSKLNNIVELLNTFNLKTTEPDGGQQESIIQLLNQYKLDSFFQRIKQIYDSLDQELVAQLNNNDNLIDASNYDRYKQVITSAIETYRRIPITDPATERDNWATLYEIITGAARTIVRVKPEKYSDNTAPIIPYGQDATYTIRDYLAVQQPQQVQQGGYNYSDIINVQDGNSIKIGNYCDGIIPRNQQTYGPFSALYPPQYNNFDIYGNLFGYEKIKKDSESESDKELKTILDKQLHKQMVARDGNARTFSSITNSNQNLIDKLRRNGSVVIFGYGFSGSGKTYSLIEGSNIDVECPMVQGGGGARAARAARAAAATKLQSTKSPTSRSKQTPTAPKGPTPTAPKGPTPTQKVQSLTPAVAEQSTISTAVPSSNRCKKYDPSMLEQFIKDNTDVLDSVEFLEIYPLGVKKGKDNIKIINETGGDDSITEILEKPVIDTYQKMMGITTGTSASMNDTETGKEHVGKGYNLYKKINLQGQQNAFTIISNRLKLLEIHRIHKLRILATPNNDKSSRSFLQITLNIKCKECDTGSNKATCSQCTSGNNPKLVFFDMPGTENTVRIKTEFMGAEIFDKIVNRNDSGDTDTTITELKIKTQQQSTLNTLHDRKLVEIYEKKTSNLTYITRIIKKRILTDINQQYKLFKYNVMQITDFGKINIYFFEDKLIGDVGMELAFFYNCKDYSDFNDIPDNQKINFLSPEDHKNIFTTFLTKFLNAKDDRGKLKFYSNEDSICKFKLDKNKVIDDATITILKEVFNIELGTEQNKAADKIILDRSKISSTKQTYKTYNLDNYSTILNLNDFDNNIYFVNPLVKCLYLIINFIINQVKTNSKISSIGTIKDADQLVYRASNFFIYKFINFIVKQGRGIVTNLEHLKYFFLSRVGGIPNYNQQNPEKALSWTATGKDDKEARENMITKPKIYKVETPIKASSSSAPILMQERVNMGELETYKLLSILQKLSNNTSDLKQLKFVSDTKQSTTGNTGYLDLLKTDAGQSALGAIFVMFTNVKVFLERTTDKSTNLQDTQLQQELGKLCTAEYDTLEFAQSISSATVSTQKPASSYTSTTTSTTIVKKLKLNDLLNQILNLQVPALMQGQTQEAGSRYKYHLRKINKKDNELVINRKYKYRTRRNISKRRKHSKSGKTIFKRRTHKIL